MKILILEKDIFMPFPTDDEVRLLFYEMNSKVELPSNFGLRQIVEKFQRKLLDFQVKPNFELAGENLLDFVLLESTENSVHRVIFNFQEDDAILRNMVFIYYLTFGYECIYGSNEGDIYQDAIRDGWYVKMATLVLTDKRISWSKISDETLYGIITISADSADTLSLLKARYLANNNFLVTRHLNKVLDSRISKMRNSKS
ncbi:MAG: hypothetical protein PF542_05400 [Nanoarchaeota archaeon]|jgi:hypothetical protein|nr:hypothetical protein [Nanoarchaeota archaeon]